MKFRIIQNRKFFYFISVALFLISIISIIAFGLKPGLDFTGGSLMELKFNITRPSSQEMQNSLAALNLGEIKIQPAGDTDVLLRFKSVDEPTHQQVLSNLKNSFQPKESNTPAIEEIRFDSIGPVIGKELQQKSWMAIFMAVALIVLYIAFAFRKVSQPVTSWKYGVTAIVALIHDILIVVGIFSLLGHYFGTEVDSLFITALLTVLGFSVHDTIVVFDRTRENLSKHYSSDFQAVVNDSVNQTLVRSINTSMTTLIVLLALYLLGGATISNFVLALIIGIAVGTYSSIFVASPLIVDWHLFEKKLKASK